MPLKLPGIDRRVLHTVPGILELSVEELGRVVAAKKL